MADIIIGIQNGSACVIENPSGLVIRIHDYDVPADWDEDDEDCKLDEDGDRYQEVVLA